MIDSFSFLTPQAREIVDTSAKVQGMQIMAWAIEAWEKHREPRPYGDNDFTVERFETSALPGLTGLLVTGHSDGWTHAYMWGLRNGAPCFFIRSTEGNIEECFRYLDGRDKGYIMTLVKGMIVSRNAERPEFIEGENWTLSALPDPRQDVSWNLRFALEMLRQERDTPSQD